MPFVHVYLTDTRWREDRVMCFDLIRREPSLFLLGTRKARKFYSITWKRKG